MSRSRPLAALAGMVALLVALTLAAAATAAIKPIPEGQVSGFGIDSQGRIVVALRAAKSSKPLVARLTAAGVLDASFARGGFLRPPVAGRGARIAVQSGGGVVVAGDKNKAAVLRRYRPDGKPDLGFGRVGKVALRYSELERLLVQPDGGILVLASTTCPVNSCGNLYHPLWVERFGKGGGFKHAYNLSKEAWSIGAAALDARGGLLVAGFEWELGYASYDRFLSDGSYAGALPHLPRAEFLGEARDIAASALAIQADGRLLIAEGSELFRTKRDGSLDPSFGDGGRVVCEGGEGDSFSASFLALAQSPDGRLLAAGADGHCGLARYLADGSPDPSFGSAGFVDLVAAGLPRARGMAALADGGLLVVGWDAVAKLAKVARFGPDGTLDTAFGVNGVASVSPPS